MDVVNRDSVKPFVTKDGSLIREILAPANSRIKKQSLAEATLAPGQATASHHHIETEEIYYILDGGGMMEIEEDKHKVCKGDAIAIPPGSDHRLTNTGKEPLVFLCCCCPPYSHEDTIMNDKA